MTDRSLIADARSHLPVTGETPAALSLRDRIAAALREAAHVCDDSCDLADEAACDAAHPIQPTVLHFDVVADINGPVDAIADVVLGVVQDELDRRDADHAVARSAAAVLLRSTADRLDAGQRPDPAVLRAAACDLDDIRGGPAPTHVPGWCGRKHPHPAHLWLRGRQARQCPGQHTTEET